MALQLHYNDLDSFNQGPLPAGMASYRNWRNDITFRFQHPRAGTIDTTIYSLPYMQVTDVAWQTGAEDVRLQGLEKATRSINISFHTGGSIDSRFRGVSTPMQMQANTTNLVFTPEAGENSLVCSHTLMRAIHINMDEAFFKSCIGTDTAWSENALTNIEKEVPFEGACRNGDITPAMRQLIQSVRQLPAATPMRNLLIQSRMLELLALQFQQFAQAGIVGSVSVEDAEKLHQLKAYLDLHFLEEHHLTGLSRRFYLNEFKVKKGFKQLFNDTVFGYLRRLRMEYAVRTLRNGNISIDEVAYDLGYEHAQHFSTAFRKFYGDSPSAYVQRKLVA